MAANVAIQHGPNDSIRPTKAKSNGRIDGIVALIMGLGRAVTHQQHVPASEPWMFFMDETPA
jgi:phage terminase large subunit-like protein